MQEWVAFFVVAILANLLWMLAFCLIAVPLAATFIFTVALASLIMIPLPALLLSTLGGLFFLALVVFIGGNVYDETKQEYANLTDEETVLVYLKEELEQASIAQLHPVLL